MTVRLVCCCRDSAATTSSILLRLDILPVDADEDPQVEWEPEDDVKERPSDPHEGKLARGKEIQCSWDRKVYECATEVEARARTGRNPVGLHWIDINRGGAEAPREHSRLVCSEVSHERDPSAHNPLEALRVLLCVACERDMVRDSTNQDQREVRKRKSVADETRSVVEHRETDSPNKDREATASSDEVHRETETGKKAGCEPEIDYRIQGILHATMDQEAEARRIFLMSHLVNVVQNSPNRMALIEDLQQKTSLQPIQRGICEHDSRYGLRGIL